MQKNIRPLSPLYVFFDFPVRILLLVFFLQFSQPKLHLLPHNGRRVSSCVKVKTCQRCWCLTDDSMFCLMKVLARSIFWQLVLTARSLNVSMLKVQKNCQFLGFSKLTGEVSYRNEPYFHSLDV